MLAQVVDDPWDTQLLPGAAQELAWVSGLGPWGCGTRRPAAC